MWSLAAALLPWTGTWTKSITSAQFQLEMDHSPAAEIGTDPQEFSGSAQDPPIGAVPILYSQPCMEAGVQTLEQTGVKAENLPGVTPLPVSSSPRAKRTGPVKTGGLIQVLDHSRWTEPMRTAIDELLIKHHGAKDILRAIAITLDVFMWSTANLLPWSRVWMLLSPIPGRHLPISAENYFRVCVRACVRPSVRPSIMSLYPLAFQLTSLVLLLVSSSSRLPKGVAVPDKPMTQHNTTQTNCSTACDNGGVSENVAAQKTSDVQTIPLLNSLTSISEQDRDQSPSSSSTHTHVRQKINNRTASLILPNQSAGENHLSKSSPSNQQALLPDHQLPLPAMGPQPVALPPTGSLSQAAQTGSITTTGITQPERNVNTAIVLLTSNDITTLTSTTTASPTPTARKSTTTFATTAATTTTTTTLRPTTTTKSATTTHTSQNAIVITTTTCTKMTPPTLLAPIPKLNAPNTGMPTINTITTNSAITPAIHNEPVSETSVAVAEVVGAALTSQLEDKVSLFAVLLFGLLFFLVAVAVFITQAYESYRRKDYTQVDYLINGMYSDSGV